MYVAHLVEVLEEVKRVLSDDGTLWLNLGDSYASQGGAANGGYDGGILAARPHVAGTRNRCRVGGQGNIKPKDLIGVPWMVAFALRDAGWYLRSDIIWSKNNPMPESVEDRPTRAHEYLFLLSKQARYYYDVDAVREEYTTRPKDWEHIPESKQYNTGFVLDGGAAQTANHQTSAGLHRQKGGVYHPLGRNRRSVWTINTKPYKGAHFAVFPPALVEPCILAGSEEGDLVLDPFCGSGTTGEVALKHGRGFLGIDLNAKYLELARDRLEQGK